MKKNSKNLSVIIATKNRAAFLSRALESVLNQTYGNVEVIVVDDASEDGTRNVIDRFRGRFKKFKYIRNERSYDGAKSRNIGIACSEGEYIAFLDDDDEWLPHKLERQVEFLNKHTDVMAVSCWFIKDAAGQKIKVKKHSKLSFNDLLWDNFLGSFSFVMVRTGIFNKVGLINEEITGTDDWELWIRIAKKYKLGVVNEFLSIYYWHTGNVSRWTSKMLSRYKKVYEMNKDSMDEDCKRYHAEKIIMNSIKLVNDRKDRMKTFFSLIKEYNMDFHKKFTFILRGLLLVIFKNTYIGDTARNASRIFQKDCYLELDNVYKKLRMNNIKESIK